MFLFLFSRRRSADPQYWQLLYQTDKSSHRRCSIKKAVFENFAIFTEKHLCWSLFFSFIKKRLQHRCFTDAKFLRTPILKNTCVRLLLNYFGKWFFVTLFMDSRFQHHPDSEILQKYQLLSNQCFKHNSTHMSSLHSTPTFPFESRFRVFIIKAWYPLGVASGVKSNARFSWHVTFAFAKT